jgi:putative addiction module component (TIGR02574 family)
MQTLTQNEITRLSPEECLALISQLWDSQHDSDVPVQPTQKAELARRLASFEHDRTQAVT